MKRYADLTSLKFLYGNYNMKSHDYKSYCSFIRAITDAYIAGMEDMDNERRRKDGGLDPHKIEWAARMEEHRNIERASRLENQNEKK